MSVVTVFGGTSLHKNRQDLSKGCDILVATPGRMIDLIDQGHLTLNAVDIAWEPKELSGPADQEFTITVTNKGAATHDFSIPDLNILTEMIAPGDSVTVKVKAPTGTYQYICTVPGHKEAGMVGTLTLAAVSGTPTIVLAPSPTLAP